MHPSSGPVEDVTHGRGVPDAGPDGVRASCGEAGHRLMAAGSHGACAVVEAVRGSATGAAHCPGPSQRRAEVGAEVRGREAALAGRGPDHFADDALHPGHLHTLGPHTVTAEDRAGAGRSVGAPLRHPKQAPERVARARHRPTWVGELLTALPHQWADLGIRRSRRCSRGHRAPLLPRALELHHARGVFRPGCRFSAPNTPSGAVDGARRREDCRQSGRADSHTAQPRCAVWHADGGSRGAALPRLDLDDQRPGGGRIGVYRRAERVPGVSLDGTGDRGLLGHLGFDKEIHPFLCRCCVPGRHAFAAIALRSAGSRSPVSARDGCGTHGQIRPRPSREANMTSIPACLTTLSYPIGTAGTEARPKGWMA